MPFANNEGVTIHFEVDGQGSPLVVQHALTSSIDAWRTMGLASPLAKDNQLIMVDARGHGQSDKPHDPELYRPLNFANDILAVLDTIGIKTAGYFGYSMGGAIGFHGIAHYVSSRFNYLILGGMSPYNNDIERREWQSYINLGQLASEKGMEAWLSSMEKIAGAALPPAYRTRMLANDPLALLSAAKSLITWSAADDILPKINVPCLIYAGEADEYYSGAKKAASMMPNARFVSFAGLNHLQVAVRPDLVLPHLKKFLTEVNIR